MPKRLAAIADLIVIPPAKRQRRSPARAAVNQAVESVEPDRMSQIYYVAARLFCERGFDATSMNDIAEAIGFTKAAVYHFIPGGKKDLLYDVISFGMDTLEREVLTPAKLIPDAEQRLRAIINSHVKIITRGSTTAGYNPVTVVVDEVAGLSPAHQRKIAQRKRAYVDLLRLTLQELKDEGKLKDVNITVSAFSLFGMVLWLARWYRPDGKLNGEQVAAELCKLALGGMLHQSEKVAEPAAQKEAKNAAYNGAKKVTARAGRR